MAICIEAAIKHGQSALIAPLGTEMKVWDDPTTWLNVSKLFSKNYCLVMLFNHEACFQALGPFHSKILYPHKGGY
jgi:hypothetical protein